jgi:hypothetical protein
VRICWRNPIRLISEFPIATTNDTKKLFTACKMQISVALMTQNESVKMIHHCVRISTNMICWC